MQNLEIIKAISWDTIDGLTWVESNAELEAAHKYFSLVKMLPQQQFTLWKLLKNAMQSINDLRFNKSAVEEETRHWITLGACLKQGLCDEIKGELILAKYKGVKDTHNAI